MRRHLIEAQSFRGVHLARNVASFASPVQGLDVKKVVHGAGEHRLEHSLEGCCRHPPLLAADAPHMEACFADDLDALLAIHRVPVRHRIRGRTTNLAERSFVEERRRTNVIGRFPDEKAAMKLVFATMIRSADRWCRVSITNPERHQLKLLRADLGLDPPPAGTDNRTTTRRRNVAA